MSKRKALTDDELRRALEESDDENHVFSNSDVDDDNYVVDSASESEDDYTETASEAEDEQLDSDENEIFHENPSLETSVMILGVHDITANPSIRIGNEPQASTSYIAPTSVRNSGEMGADNVKSPISTELVDVRFEDEPQRSISSTLGNLKRKRVESLQTTPRNKKDLRKRIGILSRASGGRKINLTPKAKKLYTFAKSLRTIARKLDFENATVKERLKQAENFTKTPNFIRSRVNDVTYKFIMSHLEQQSRKSKGRKFSLDDKILALSLMKQSPKGYRLLRKIFALPSRSTLDKLLTKIPFAAGINMSILHTLKDTVAKFTNIQDRFCTVIFDEMALSPGLMYNRKLDVIDGFVDYGNGCRKKAFANHVLGFMARGINRKGKQPVRYYFTQGGMDSIHLKKYLVETIQVLQSIALTIIASTCDQLAANTAVYRKLLEDTELFYRKKKYGKQPVDSLNNLLQKDVIFKMEGVDKTGCWQDISQFYELDVGDDYTKMCNKLTDAHIYQDKMKKMKVNLAAQVFSRSVSSIMRGLVRLGVPNISHTTADTADFLMFCDKLFDSVNGTALTNTDGKSLRTAITETSEHHSFWKNEALITLSSMKFIKQGKIFRPPSVRPFPKAEARKVSRGGPKPGRCRVLTDTPEKEEIENEEAARNMKNKCKVTKKVQVIKRKVFQNDDSSSLEEDEASYSSNDSEDDELEAAESVDIEEQNDVKIENIRDGDYALARVAGKRTEHFYIVEIQKVRGSILELSSNL
ncbi:thap domain-containing protein 9 [Holotrichia oblita]|uniref:Thap domain-containing protein 9 n=1 Tax=Holotrichia oblita TaxID=644536 RepID=A0ACB9STN0_HOLOL|nr:thap domain-containing protein 9 [Holotrichia oblita]